MEDTTILLKKTIDEIVSYSSVLEIDDVPAIGRILRFFDVLEGNIGRTGSIAISSLSKGLAHFLEKFLLEENGDFQAYDEGIILLQKMVESMEDSEKYTKEVDAIINKLNIAPAKQSPPNSMPDEKVTVTDFYIEEDDDGQEDIERTNGDLSEEDMGILTDFIIEARDNLESIELNLIDLEQNPDDMEIINSIFRPFHTIKGVSGFLNLNTINNLSHSTENLLDSARQGKIIIDNEIIDIILESVDAHTQMISTIESNLSEEKSIFDDEYDVSVLINKIEEINLNYQTQDTKRLGDILVEEGTLNEEDLESCLHIQKKHPEKKLGEILVDNNKVGREDIISALKTQKTGKGVTDTQVKVDTVKLDNLVDLTGELVISQSMLRQNGLALTGENQKLNQNLSQLTQIVSSIQKIAMSMRMVQIKSTFKKMVRLVRDLSRSSGKEVGLEMFGEDTEIDRNVVDALYEPMVHMIRNSIDHGIETPEARKKAGKNHKGMIFLRAYQKGGNIRIEIEDNGKGLEKDKILKKAISANLVGKDVNLSDYEIYELIMHPGFSTADKITDISGRGVGMDVVKKMIEDLRGRLDIQSFPDKGSKFTINLPLTLAIIEGMLVRVGGERYIVPTLSIRESLKLNKKDYHTVEGKGEMIKVREKLIPLIRLDQMFDVRGDSEKPWDGLMVIVENKEETRALLLDELLGKEEFVIKSLGESFKDIKGLAGGTILGDGRVGLILDMAGLFDVAFNTAAA